MDKNQVHHGPAEEDLVLVADESVHMVVTSPPYNLGVDYGEHDDDMTSAEYTSLLMDVLEHCYRVLIPGGRMAIVVGLGGGIPCEDIPQLVKNTATAQGFRLRDKFVWYKGPSESTSAWGSWRSPSNPSQIQNHEEILVFYKETPRRSPRSDYKMDKDEFLQNIKSVWKVNPGGIRHHPAVYPVEIPRRLITLYSFPDDIILDPFLGSGTTAIAAERLRRRWIGMEIDPNYVELARSRIEQDRNDTGRPASLL